jgi:glycosyltransferase involved in cell wall biosynthesis
MKVLYVINSLGGGGAERSLAELLPRLREFLVDPIVVCLERDEGALADVLAEEVPVHFLVGGDYLSRVRELRGIIRRESPEIVHTCLFEADVIGRLSSIGLRHKVVTSLVNTAYERGTTNDPNVARHKLLLARLVDSLTARVRCDGFHAISQAVRDSSIRTMRIKRSRVEVIYRGRAVERLGTPSPDRRSAARLRLAVPDEAFVVVNLARHEYQKGLTTLVAATDHLIGESLPVLVLQAGRRGNASRALASAIAALPDPSRFRLLGFQDDIADVLAAADLFAFPSHYEGLGGALLEAMAMGLPIVASDIAAIREVVEPDGNAILVGPADPRALASAIKAQMMEPRLRARLASRSSQIFEERFRIDDSVARLYKWYWKVLAA